MDSRTSYYYVEIFFLASIHVTQAGIKLIACEKGLTLYLVIIFLLKTSHSKFLSWDRVKTELRDRAQRTKNILERVGARERGWGGGLEGERMGRRP